MAKPQHKIYHPKSHPVAIVFSSKDRVAMSHESVAPLLEAQGYDLFWVDGSTSEQGRNLPYEYAARGRIAEVHSDVGGGADAAILYSLSLLLERGYDYIGLVENDVKLRPGWWPALFELFARGKAEGLDVGAVSARCHERRMLMPRSGYALMMNVAAGMTLMTREAVEIILDHYHTVSVGEIAQVTEHFTHLYAGFPWQTDDPRGAQHTHVLTTADWMFDVHLLAHGKAALALTPSYTDTLDPATQDPLQRQPTLADASFDWKGVCQRYTDAAASAGGVMRHVLNHYNTVTKRWRAYPQQMVKALPGCFNSDWKCIWSKFMGPFGFSTLRAGAKLRMPVYGKQIEFVLSNNGQPFTVTVNGRSQIAFTQKDQWVTATVAFTHSMPQIVELTFDQPGVMLGQVLFEGPQPWFKSRYGLRYGDLARFIEA